MVKNKTTDTIETYGKDFKEKHPEKISEKNKGLEKIISGIFIFSFLVGLFLSLYETGLTGNVIGLSGNIHNLLEIILIYGVVIQVLLNILIT
jgi:hypothetical protein